MHRERGGAILGADKLGQEKRKRKSIASSGYSCLWLGKELMSGFSGEIFVSWMKWKCDYECLSRVGAVSVFGLSNA